MRKTLSLSTHLDISREVLEDKGILDITLGLDTPYFVDPRLFFSRKLSGNFLDSNKIIISLTAETVPVLAYNLLVASFLFYIYKKFIKSRKEKTLNKILFLGFCVLY